MLIWPSRIRCPQESQRITLCAMPCWRVMNTCLSSSARFRSALSARGQPGSTLVRYFSTKKNMRCYRQNVLTSQTKMGVSVIICQIQQFHSDEIPESSTVEARNRGSNYSSLLALTLFERLIASTWFAIRNAVNDEGCVRTPFPGIFGNVVKTMPCLPSSHHHFNGWDFNHQKWGGLLF